MNNIALQSRLAVWRMGRHVTASLNDMSLISYTNLSPISLNNISLLPFILFYLSFFFGQEPNQRQTLGEWTGRSLGYKMSFAVRHFSFNLGKLVFTP